MMPMLLPNLKTKIKKKIEMSFTVVYSNGQFVFTFSNETLYFNANEFSFEIQANNRDVFVGDSLTNRVVNYTNCTSPSSSSAIDFVNKVKALLITSSSTQKYHFVSATSTNPTVIKAAPGRLLGWCLTSSVLRYLKFHDQATTPTAGVDVYLTVGTTTIGSTIYTIPGGMTFSNGIAFTTTTGVADSDTGSVTLNNIAGDIYYI
jgi:hypothetical protein